MPRQARLDAPGTLHHVIIRGIERRKIVNDDRDRDNFVGRMGEIALDTGTAIYGWSLMSNHAHILLRSGAAGLPTYMRRLLSGYATWYNLRHRRHGHLFQNRYKSIICEEDTYFKELVRYIHLNPLRARLVDSMAKLERYGWCGHAVLMGRVKRTWQDTDYVLTWFGETLSGARKAYRQYVNDGVALGRRPDLVGGGLIRSQGGWSVVKAMRCVGFREKGDERILGSGEFVEKMLKQADGRIRYQLPTAELAEKTARLIEEACEKQGVEMEALRSGSRRQAVSRLRSFLAAKLVNEYGLSMAETARRLGVSTAAIANSIRRR